jgi:acyl-CoA dehydrogenase family protein 9
MGLWSRAERNAMAEPQSLMKPLFHGVIPEGMVFPFPEASREEREQTAMILDGVRRFVAREVDSARIDREGRIPASVMQGLGAQGLFGLRVPARFGGKGLTTTSHARVLEELAGLDGALALTVGAHGTLGLGPLLLFGTEAQQIKYLPRLVTGEALAAFALTEPGAGSDSAGIATRARVVGDGISVQLDGEKCWIANAPAAEVFTVFARTADDEGVRPRLTAYLVERGRSLRTGEPEPTHGVRGLSLGSVHLDGVRVPAANVLGEVGRGHRVAVEVLNDARIALAAACVGACKRLVRLTVERCEKRRAFGRSIGEFGLIKDKVARMMSDLYALESMTYLTAGLADGRRADYSIESAICKVFGSETLWRIAHEAMQVAGGQGFVQRQPWERLLRDARAMLVFEGTNEILRAFIALAGMQGPGQRITEVARAIREPIKGFGLLGDFALQMARSALGRERLDRAHPALRRETVLFEQYTEQLARQVDKVLRRHGSEIAEMQFTQRRVSALAIDLYGLAATVSRTTRVVERKGEDGARRELNLAAAFANGAEQRMKSVVASFDENDDELRKGIATRAYGDGGYPFDVLLS